MWEEDGKGNWKAEKGDNAWTLHKQLGISYKDAISKMKDQGFKFSNDDKKVDVNIGDVFKSAVDKPNNSSNENSASNTNNNSQTANTNNQEANNQTQDNTVSTPELLKSTRGPALSLLGQNSIATRGKFKGATEGTSLASKYLSRLFPQTYTGLFGNQVGKQIRSLVGTNVVGRSAGRFVPVLGLGLTIHDFSTYIAPGLASGVSGYTANAPKSKSTILSLPH